MQTCTNSCKEKQNFLFIFLDTCTTWFIINTRWLIVYFFFKENLEISIPLLFFYLFYFIIQNKMIKKVYRWAIVVAESMQDGTFLSLNLNVQFWSLNQKWLKLNESYIFVLNFQHLAALLFLLIKLYVVLSILFFHQDAKLLIDPELKEINTPL